MTNDQKNKRDEEATPDEVGTQTASTPDDEVSQTYPMADNSHQQKEGFSSTDTPKNGGSATDPTEDEVTQDRGTDEPEMFPREYVVKLRKEAADNRAKAKRIDALEAEIWQLKAAATGRLADPSDLPYQPGEDIDQAIEVLLALKPHLAARRPRGNIGQGATPTAPAVSLIDMLR